MAVSTRLIKRRIKSIRNTRKITKAMEMVAASKMRKSVSSVLSSRAYANLSWETVQAISALGQETAHPLLRANPKAAGVLVVLIASDRGLCGGYNSKIMRETLKRSFEGQAVDFLTIGKRGAEAIKRKKLNLAASFVNVTNNPTFADIKPIAKLISDDFTSGKYSQVILAYTDFISAINQIPRTLELLPMKLSEVKGSEINQENIFEPSAAKVLDSLLPKVFESMFFQAVLEAAASEHSARMVAMQSASDAAGEMIDALTFAFNQARQAGITNEIAEISSGKAALE